VKPAGLAIQAACLTLGQFSLRSIDVTLDAGEILVLLGPNGAGKSVCLEMIAGFHRPYSGRIIIHGRDVTDLPPEQRRIGFMFQNFGLFPHLTVARNVAFGLRARGLGHGPVSQAIADLLRQFGILHLSARFPQDLSPGEKQRAALARALAARPELFLFDEPFSALDSRTRDQLRDELKTFLHDSGVPAIFVSHDQTDAALLADRVAILDRGAVQQEGAATTVLGKPANRFVATFIGVENILPGRPLDRHGAMRRVQVANAVLYAACADEAAAEALLCIRAEDVMLRPLGGAGPPGLHGSTNRIAGFVSDIRRQGLLIRVTVDCGFPLAAGFTQRELQALSLSAGQPVMAEIDASAIHLLMTGARGPSYISASSALSPRDQVNCL
jgi:molybdate/tungstate transport system ATP-binding protein